jgi:hypothetical protein
LILPSKTLMGVWLTSSFALAACTPPPAPPPPPPVATVRPPEPAKPPPAPEVHWDTATSDETGVTLSGPLTGNADAVEAVASSVSCSRSKLGRGEITGERASLRLDAAEVATAVQCHGLGVTVLRGAASTTAVVPFDLTVNLLPGAAGGVGVSRTTTNPNLVLAVPGTSATSQLTLGGDTYVARGVVGPNVEFAVPILALTRAALRRQHAVAATGLKPIEYVLALTIAGRTLPSDEPAHPPP